jgi:putative ABC transport system permease protein
MTGLLLEAEMPNCYLLKLPIEVGIGMALGADQREIVKLIVGQGLRITLWNVAAGLAMALAVTRLIAAMLHGVKPSDPAMFVAVALLVLPALILVALFACYIPARRASKVDPAVSLRYE